MSRGVAEAVERLQTIVAAVTGIRSAVDPPEQLPPLPCAIVGMGAGFWHCEAKMKQWRGDLIIDLFVKREGPGLARAYNELMTYTVGIANQIENDPLLNSTVDNIMFPIRQSAPAGTEWGGREALMVEMTVPVKITTAIEV